MHARMDTGTDTGAHTCTYTHKNYLGEEVGDMDKVQLVELAYEESITILNMDAPNRATK